MHSFFYESYFDFFFLILVQFLLLAGGEQMGNRYPEKPEDTDQVDFLKSQIFSRKMLDSMSV